jgi:hypothetical protein
MLNAIIEPTLNTAFKAFNGTIKRHCGISRVHHYGEKFNFGASLGYPKMGRLTGLSPGGQRDFL